MSSSSHISCPASAVEIRHCLREKNENRTLWSILHGLSAPQKKIPSVYFYDDTGSKLFEHITRLPEYYPNRTEKNLLKQMRQDIVGFLQQGDVIEFGSGDCSKISLLLEAVPAPRRQRIRYIPVDVSGAALRESAHAVVKRFPGIAVQGLVADFGQFELLPSRQDRLFCFFGSTLGNLSRDEAVEYLSSLCRVMRQGDALLLGLDMTKQKDVLERAYNDSQGVTAEFNRNILRVVNCIAGTDFDPDRFAHLAFYDETLCRIEMHLQALGDMEVRCPHVKGKLKLTEGETIHTENSHKFTPKQIARMAADAGLMIRRMYTDENRWFSLVQLTKR
ncbi:MAG: L-histidine N(alpha)-methyltransferase [Candidatus Omnitrophica bacterium]|nr:L-histidine N(alpha)-methyltransferase [Candidatus Omnitrophota bacterium]